MSAPLYETLNKKLAKVTEAELSQVTGGGERRVFSEYPEPNVRITVDEPVLDTRHIQIGNELSYPEKFLNMINHQQGYQSNSRLLTTSDAILEKIEEVEVTNYENQRRIKRN